MNTHEALQDSRLHLTDVLAELIGPGVVVVDGGQPAFADSHARALLDAPDDDALRERWGAIGRQFDAMANDVTSVRVGPVQHSLEVATGTGIRALRFELRRGDARRAVWLLRERTKLQPGDHTLLLAGEALANRQVLTGLIHEMKGPLNNFTLTLALVASGLASAQKDAISSDLLAKWRRYLEVLRDETARLAGCLDDLYKLTEPGDAARTDVDLVVLLHEVQRVLRHEATMREVTLDIDLPPDAHWMSADAHLLRVALLGFTTVVLDITSAEGRVTWRVERDATPGRSTLHLASSNAILPPGLVSRVFSIGPSVSTACASAVAARIIIELHGGTVTLDDPDRPSGFLLRVPLS